MKALRTWMIGVAVAGLGLAGSPARTRPRASSRTRKENTAAVKEEAKEAEAGTA